MLDTLNCTTHASNPATCEPADNAPEWQKKYWQWGIDENFYYICILYFIDVQVFLGICICNFLMTSMGNLALELNHSVHGIYKNLPKSYFFCTVMTYKIKRAIVYTVCLTFAIVALAVLIKTVYSLIGWG